MKLERLIENNNFSDNCVWEGIFNDDEIIILEDGFLLTGFLSVSLSSWLSVTLLFSSIGLDRSYRNLANFILTACIRRALPLLIYLPFVKWIAISFGFHAFSCGFFAFWETFLAVFEVECLTHVCIERYVLAKYVINGWQVKQEHYYLYPCLCLLFSCLYSVPPLFGIGHYGSDFQCTSCTFDIVLPANWLKYIVVAIFILRSIKPTVVMIMMLIWARVLESKLPFAMRYHQHFTRSTIVITVVNLLCWTPIAMIRGSVVISQLTFVNLLWMTSGDYVMWAMWIHWVAPALTVIALCIVDDRVRCEMFNIGTRVEPHSIDNKQE